MRICRYDNNNIGVVRGDQVHDVSEIINEIGPVNYPFPRGDLLIANLDRLRPIMEELADKAPGKPISGVKLLSPVANPTKVIGTPVNYKLHAEEGVADEGIRHGRAPSSIEQQGLFLKANSALIGCDEGVAVRFPDRRTDHEAELGVIIGKQGSDIPYEDAMSYVAGYAVALDMVVRGPEDRSLRKGIDGYSVLGPWLVTADEIPDPDNLNFEISVNGEVRQKANTSDLIFDCRRLIEYASSFYTLYPGDVIMTGTPEGVGPVEPGDVMHCEIEGIGAMDVELR